MNDFQSIGSGKGMLKSNYTQSTTGMNDEDPALEALRRRRRNLTNQVVTPTKEKIEQSEAKDDGNQ